MDRVTRKRVLRMLTNGMYVLTSRTNDHFGAATVTWVSQASFRPPLLMAAVRRNSNVFTCMAASRMAALHIVGCDQPELAQKFFSPTTAGDGRINGEPFTEGVTGAPILTSLGAYVECRVTKVVETGGDHAVVIMEVVEAGCRPPIEALTIAASPWEYGG